MIRRLKAMTVVVGIVGAVIIAVAMLLGPLIAEPAPSTVERFTIFAYPTCMFLGGIFAVLRTRIALIYGVLAIAFAVAFVVISLVSDNDFDTLVEKGLFAMLVIGPALILTSLSWSIMHLESQPAIPTRLG